MAQDVFSKMAEDPWLLNEDGYLNADTDIKEIIYHPTLNVILICTNSGIVRVLDVNSGVVLQSSYLSAINQNEVTCKYIPGQDRVLFCDGQAIGIRSDYNGVLLLDSILQKPVSDSKKEIKLELLLSEAIIFKQGIISANVSGIEHVINELTDVILNAQKQSKKGIKAQKWNTVCLQLPLEMLQAAASSAVSEMLSKNQHTPELGVASAVQERLSELSGEQGSASDRRSMASEAKRRETFSHWPHMDYKWALPDQMAQAGFYHQPNASGDDRAMCFTCTVCLVCWERTDEPWSEHERHSPNCPFVMGEYTQNVPLSVTYATNPAINATYRGMNVKILGTSSVSNLLATSTSQGLISVFDISGKIDRTHAFFVTQFDSHILEKYTQEFGIPGTWSDLDEVKYPAEKRITALSVVGEKSTNTSNGTTAEFSIRPTIICGLNIRSRSTQKPQFQYVIDCFNDQNKNSLSSSVMDVSETPNVLIDKSCLYLVVYDFMYSKEKDECEQNEHKAEVNATSDVVKTDTTQDENKKNNYIHTEMFEHLSSLYKTLIPGESDEVFYPPPLHVTKPQQHSGPRVLPIDMQITETDASQTEPYIINQDYSFMNGQLSSVLTDSLDKTISDHITELKNSKTNKKLNYSRAIQCLSLPSQYKNRKDLDISNILTTQDGCHVLVVLKNLNDGISVLILYGLDFTQKMVKLYEEPVLVRELNNSEKPLEVTLLPIIDKLGEYSEQMPSNNGIAGNIVMVCADGAVRIIELATMKTLCLAQLEGEKFVSAAYCNSLERLCASTEKGSLHFYALNDTDNESSEDHEEDDLFGLTSDSMVVNTSQPSETVDSSSGSNSEIMTRCFHEPPELISLGDLKRLHGLCQFEPLKAGYCAVVPPCWSEIQQAQRQRKHPQSIKSDIDQYTKTWRLQTDTTTWDEHIFEITLPTPMALGHVDVHFTLQSSTTLPRVEVTLLRQNTSGIGHKRDVTFSVDETITIDMLQQWADNPVISQEYLRAHNADILAGPVNITSSLDLSEQCGVVTLTSPKLFKSRNRTLLLHIRAVYSKDEANNKNGKGKRAESKGAAAAAGLSDKIIGSKNEFYMGCDCIHELSVTVYSSKHTDVVHEKSQRNCMLESNAFVQSLLLTAINNSSTEVVNLALDILNWVASIRFVRNRSNNGEIPNQQLELIYIVEYNLPGILHQCLLLGERSIAHKCMKFLQICCNGSKNMNESGRTHFEFNILKALLSILNSIHEVKSAGGLQWIFALLLKVTSKNSQYVATKCVTLLNKISDELGSRINPYHLLLRSRYGLYGTPLELELFDIDPPAFVKGSSMYVSYASAVSGDNQNQSSDFFENYSCNKESINPKDVLSGSDTKLKWRNLALPKIYKGLIETEPLHFICISASEGTRLERADASNNIVINEMPITNYPVQPAAIVNKKLLAASMFKEYVEELDYSAQIKEVKSGSSQGTSSVNHGALTWDENNSMFVGINCVTDSMYQNLKWIDKKSSAPPETSSAPKPAVWQQENLLATPNSSNLSWQHLLVTPPQQVMVVERMHSGARRFVTLDFGQPILLTDIHLPASSELVSVSLDIWLKSEDVDGTRLVVATDIGTKNLVLNDLQPPPLCRYMKITTVGKHGMTTARVRIPIGYFYGHVVVLPDEIPPELESSVPAPDVEKQLTILSKLFEDISCRYSLACSKLKELLRPFLVADMKNASHLATYMNIMRSKSNSSNPEHSKLFSAYQESITYQRQLNTVRNVMTRLEGSLNKSASKTDKDIASTSTDKLRAIAEGILEVLLTIDSTIDLDAETCKKLFQGLCVSQSSRLQLLTAIFLDKSCRSKSYWGNFLADSLTEMFATSNTTRFPQDRVFILLAYLSRKSPERSAVIDAGLRVVSQTLQPVMEERRSLLAVSVDLPLLSWLLMYLSLQLDLSKNSLQSATRWDWVFGEVVGKANAESSKLANRKKCYYKRFNNKQQVDDELDTAQKLVQTSAQVQALSALSNHAASLNKLNATLKTALTREHLLKEKFNKYKFKDIKNSTDAIIGGSKKVKETASDSAVDKENDKKTPQYIDGTHCLLVAKGLLRLVLSMDHSSSADMLLLSFKVMGRLVSMAKIKLGQLMNQEQLLNLINFCLASKIPWASHALACLLQDVLENEINENESGASTSWATNDFLSDVANLCEFTDDDENFLPENVGVSVKPLRTSTPLPSVDESNDSDLEEFVDSLLNKEAGSAKKPPKVSAQTQTTNSVAIDSRLDLTVDAAAEISLRKLLNKNTQRLLNSVNAVGTTEESEEGLAPWPVPTPPLPLESNLGNMTMLNQCFDSLFQNLQFKDSSYIENVLQLWLTLNSPYKDDKFDPSAVPQIILKDEAVKSLVTALGWASGLSVSTWFVALQTLTLMCNTNSNNGSDGTLYWSDAHGMAACIVNHPDFIQIFLRLLSGSGVTFIDKSRAGPTLCKALSDFIDRLLMRCYVESPRSKTGKLLKILLLKIVHQMVHSTGSIAMRQGYLDVQCTILKSMLEIDYSNSDVTIAMSIFENTAVLVHSYFVNVDKIKCINIGEKNNIDSSTFNEIFACVMGSDPTKMDFQVSTDLLFLRLLKVLGKLVQTQFRQPDDMGEAMDVEPLASSQTDESKAEQIQQQDSIRPVNRGEVFADMILQNEASIIRLCHSLAACKSSSLCMLANVSQKTAFPNLSEPGNVGDAVFHVLALLAKRTTDKKLMLPPLLQFFMQTPQLSEPLLWFILQVLNTEEAIRNFLNAGGIDMLARSFVISSNTPNTISKSGTISTVMQHFSGVNPTSDASTAIASASASRKLQQATIENKLSLVNFAPCCTISCASGTAQPAEILIQCTAATHRRARTPQWSYHFYPDEAYTELILQLPSAILLREVHLQPHLSSLATCPSSVAIEVSANGPSRLVPVCPPLSTSGMVFIRLHLPVPEVVNCVLIRLYRPRDANNIGLSQIRILGNLAFGGNTNQLVDGAEDESHCRHSLGWLRLLHHCFTLPTDPTLTNQVIACASEVPRLLSTCCELLLVPSHVLPIYLPCLEKVLRELSLHNVENGTGAIKILLNSQSSIIEPLNFADSCWQDRLLINATGYQSACELLYQICEHQDEDTAYRVAMILEWVQTVADRAIETGDVQSCNPAYISSIASILWSANQTNVNYNLPGMITLEFFDRIYNLKINVENNIALKYSLDSLLCSLCYIKPELYPVLLQRIGVLVPNLSTDRQASISDDRKDSESMTDDTKQTFELDSEWYGHLVMGDLSKLNLSNEQLETVALVSRSPSAIQQLLDSGLPKMLNSAIFEFCTTSSDDTCVPMAKLENVTAILKFFTNVCDEKTMQDWLGSSDGSSFWLYLLHWLCKKPFIKNSNLQSEAHAQLEEVCVKFLSKCCLCHPSNQDRLAKVLCEVISLQSNGISGFLRRLTLQLLLEIEKIPVSIQADETLYKNVKLTQAYLPVHPAFKQTYNRALLYLSTNTSLADILEHHIYFKTTYKMETNISSKKTLASKKDIFKGWFTEDSDLSMAAGVTAKDKRAKDAKNQITATPQSKKKRYTPSENQTTSDVIGGRLIKCEAFSDQPLPLNLTLGQLLKLIENNGPTADWPCVHLLVCQNKTGDKRNDGNEVDSTLYQQQPFSSALQVFSSMGGLALLAQHLPTVYPEAVRPPPKEKLSSEQSDSDWIKIEDCDDIYEDVEEAIGTSSPSKSTGIISNVPAHSLTAFGLFLRLPGYADILLKDMKKALCLLRLVLGVTDDEEGGDIFQSPIAESLPTVPFEVLKKLYDATPLGTDDGRLLRRISINTGVVHLLLACLGIFTHQTQANNDKDQKETKGKEERSQLYWAKGTGFGTGSTQQSWNVEQALLKQRSEEEHVTVLLQVIASYISPNGEGGDKLMDDVLPPTFHDLLANSSLLPALSSYLRNDSVLDMARHIPLYRAALQLLRALAASSQLVDLLLPQKNRVNEPSIISLLKNMKTCVDTYASKLRINTKINTKFKTKLREQLEELEQGEGLATLMPDIQETANLVAQVTSGLIDSDQVSDGDGSIERLMFASSEEKYLKIMKNLQFGSYEMITELADGGLVFAVSHHFEGNAKLAGEQSHPTRVKRIAQEAVTLSTSLPLSYSSSVFVRYDTSRLDVMKVLITGPSDTPYANGCFELDVFFPPDYPLSPMMINLETTGHHTIRFNPNLYNDGKVCLSVLNTWHGRPEEKWNAQTSSFLQVLVSIQSLILVPEPYFNEPGYERSRGTQAGTQSSREYNANICQATVRWAMLEQILNPCLCFKEIIHTHFYLKRNEILAQVEGWIKDLENDISEKRISRTANKRSPAANIDSFKKIYQQLKEQLMKLKPPEGVSDEESQVSSTTVVETTTTVNGYDNAESNETDTDIDMEKMVKEMCEFDAT